MGCGSSIQVEPSTKQRPEQRPGASTARDVSVNVESTARDVSVNVEATPRRVVSPDLVYKHKGHGDVKILDLVSPCLDAERTRRLETCVSHIKNFFDEQIESSAHLWTADRSVDLTARLEKEVKQVSREKDYLCRILLLPGLKHVEIDGMKVPLVKGCQRMFSVANCPQLGGKPKIFVIIYFNISDFDGEEAPTMEEIPDISDVFVHHVGALNFDEGVECGSILCNVLEEEWRTKHLQEMFTTFRRRLHDKFKNFSVQPWSSSIMRKHFFFDPKK